MLQLQNCKDSSTTCLSICSTESSRSGST